MCAVYLWFSQRVTISQYEDRKLRLLFLMIAAGFLIVAVPIQLKGQWVTIGWAAEATDRRRHRALRGEPRMRYHCGLFVLAVYHLLMVDSMALWELLTSRRRRLFLNASSAPSCLWSRRW